MGKDGEGTDSYRGRLGLTQAAVEQAAEDGHPP